MTTAPPELNDPDRPESNVSYGSVADIAAR